MPFGPVAPARAQVSASASLTSDYQYRGVSLSDGEPALAVNIAYDRAGGGYVGGSGIAEETAADGPRVLGHVEYVGYSRRIDTDRTWDVGVINQGVDKYYDRRYSFDYVQAYTGIITRTFSYYIYYAPDYFGSGLQSLYAEVNGAFRPARRWRVFGHLGALAAFGGSDRAEGARQKYDLRAGFAAQFERVELQLAWTTVLPDAGYLAGRPQSRAALVASASFDF
ncbi:MAG: TorF family putative porin [Caulobacteraceae bacterium]